MKRISIKDKKFGAQAGSFLFLIHIGLLIFVLFSHIRPMLPDQIDLIGRIVMIFTFLVCSMAARKSQHFKKYWPVIFACFIASLAISIDYYLPSREWLLLLFNVSIKTPAGIALEKLDSFIIISITIIFFTKISGADLTTIYLSKGILKKGLLIGGMAFLVSVAGSIPVSEMFFGGRNLQVAKVLSWTPWILIFVIGNAFTEELLFRGLFLKKYNPFLGKFCSNMVIAIPFTLHHTGVSYTPDELMFFAILFPLALVWGYLMQKTDSLWGSVLFHAGTDIPIALSIFSALQ
jgi:membrane protease YdiL (CAAX protease family)